MAKPVIQTPKGAIFVGKKTGRASLRMKLEWRRDFKRKWQTRYTDAQRYVDAEVLRRSEPYTPLLTGTLIKTGILGTEIGEGEVEWIAPYAEAQYYLAGPIGRPTGPLRGPFWFERMKAVSGQNIIKRARRIAGQGRIS